MYGSGYPGLGSQRGVDGLGFPFTFYPVVYHPGKGPDYLYRGSEVNLISHINS